MQMEFRFQFTIKDSIYPRISAVAKVHGQDTEDEITSPEARPVYIPIQQDLTRSSAPIFS